MQTVASAENILKIPCGAHTLEVRLDALTPEQEEQLKELKTRCRIENVAHKQERKPGFIGSGVYSDPANRDLVGPDVGR